MIDFFSHLFDTTGFPQRWYCGTGWTPQLGWLHIVSDLGVWSAYFTIPLLLVYFAKRRPDIPFRRVFLLFGCFILFCGLTHLMDAAIFWWPAYRLSALIRFATAAVSWATVVALIPVLPRALALRSPVELEKEIVDRKRAEESLLKLHYELEKRVEERTAELTQANAALRDEIEKRRAVETQLRESEEQLRSAVAELQSTDRRKDEFLAILSHELRNPMAAISNALQIMQIAPGDTELVDEARDTMDRQFQHLVRLVDDLLDVSRIMRGKIDLRSERVALESVVMRAVEVARPLLDANKHSLTISLPETPVEFMGDSVRLTQVVGNLLNNAAKYTDPGGRISLAASIDEGQLVMKVGDNGIGIDAATLPRVFDMFMQADQGLARSRGGLGIGLPLVKKLVQLHGGSVHARSEGQGRGSEFEIRLPLVNPQDLPAGTGSGNDASQRVAPRQILIVDDNQDSAATLGGLLRSLGHRVTIANDGPTALALAEGELPEVVILDLGMPGMDGLEVALRLRATHGPNAFTIVALTGWGGTADRERTAAAGFDFHFVKPLQVGEIQAVLAGLASSKA